MEKLTKKDLINIISKMKKKDLIQIIKTQVGGGNEAIRSSIIFNKTKLKNKNTSNTSNISMNNDNIYNEVI
jgi:hypothetical protein